jgi:hypothetical protein
MRTLVFVVLMMATLQGLSQRACSTQDYLEQQQAQQPAYAAKRAAIESFIRQQRIQTTTLKTEARNTFQIPVVVHILYNTSAQNISDAQVASQLAALNRDFNKQNPDSVNIPERFKALAADIEIEFALATADPMGRPTTGIIRKHTAVAEWTMDDKIKFSAQGGDNAWDSKSYLNIWVGNVRQLLGYASEPGGSTEKDGVVINTSAFGTINTGAPYNLGRTAVHEVSHWLGLKHIWGDTYCGDDLVDDTPKQGNYTTGCPTAFRTSCGNNAIGDMYMNYMDFTNDACINLFTEGQKLRMRSLFNAGGPRQSLLSTKGLNEPWLQAAPVEEAPVAQREPRIYPNPAAGDVVLDLSGQSQWVGSDIKVIAVNGVEVLRQKVSSTQQKIDLSRLAPGIYMVWIKAGKEEIRQKLVKY